MAVIVEMSNYLPFTILYEIYFSLIYLLEWKSYINLKIISAWKYFKYWIIKNWSNWQFYTEGIL